MTMRSWMLRQWHCAPGCLLLFAAAGTFFTFFPQADLDFSNLFYADHGLFPANDWWVVQILYHGTPWFGRLFFLVAIVISLSAIFKPSIISRRHWRRAAGVIAVVVVGIGMVVHVFLKEGMGRPRPRDVQIFQGNTANVPVFLPSQFCQKNCSFVSGHAAVGFALMSVGLLGVRRRRQFWFLTGLFAGSVIGLVRIMQGGHFLSDVVFSLVSIWAVHLFVRAIWIRFRALQLQRPMVSEIRHPSSTR
jgi:lipid A 4'-phosphatase